MAIGPQKAVVVGLGKSGIEAARYLKARHMAVTISDCASFSDHSPLTQRAMQMDISLELGGHKKDTFVNADLVVISPGVPHTIPAVRAAGEKGVPVIGEIELAAREIRAPIVAVTGTNGKTTTTTLVGEMLQQSGLDTFIGGNIGNPLTAYINQDRCSDRVVVEISSFQLDTICRFRPHVAVLLNISPDHLDRYDSVEAYVRSKARIFENQTTDDIAVLNGGDAWVRSIADRIEAQRLFFAGCRRDENGLGAQDDHLVLLDAGNKRDRPFALQKLPSKPIVSIDPKSLQLRHNLENIQAACLGALAAGGSIRAIQKTIDAFRGLEHRMEHVATLNGVAFYNDSKSTNPGSVVHALRHLKAPVVLIMGGRAKNSDFSVLTDGAFSNIKSIWAMGEAADTLFRVLAPRYPVQRAADVTRALAGAFRHAAPGDTVLFSPGCTSFDHFRNYQERGRAFRRAVNALEKRLA